jgi:non-ribosomal peptide synthetase component F
VTRFAEAFRAAVARNPDATAIEDTRRAWSYRALLAAAEAEAAQYAAGEIVILRAERTARYVTELLAVWLAGAAFVPLDPAMPEARARFVREKVALAQARQRAAPEDLAYIIFTSGSTGRPKGVRVGHGGITSLLEAQYRLFGLGPGKRSLFFLSPSFDASLSDIGTALLSEATLVIDEDARLRTDPLGVLRERRITHADLPPSLAALFDTARLPQCLETLIVGGEACDPARIRALAKRVRVVNVYGPTEATICTSMVVCDAATWDAPALGAPVPGVTYEV